MVHAPVAPAIQELVVQITIIVIGAQATGPTTGVSVIATTVGYI